MKGAAARVIRSQGSTYDVQNDTTDGGGRSTPSYSPDGTLVGVLESRGMPQTATDSDGTEVETDLEIRAVPDVDVDLIPAGSDAGYPTLLEHPDGRTYRLLDKHTEDGGIAVLTVVTN